MSLSKTQRLKKWFVRVRDNRDIDHYSLLGIELFESDPVAIESAASERVELLEKMSNAGFELESAKDLSRRVVSAKICLSDRMRRIKYDKALMDKVEGKQMPVKPTLGKQRQAGADSAASANSKPGEDSIDGIPLESASGETDEQEGESDHNPTEIRRSQKVKQKQRVSNKTLLVIGLAFLVCSVALAAALVTVNQSLTKVAIKPLAEDMVVPDAKVEADRSGDVSLTSNSRNSEDAGNENLEAPDSAEETNNSGLPELDPIFQNPSRPEVAESNRKEEKHNQPMTNSSEWNGAIDGILGLAPPADDKEKGTDPSPKTKAPRPGDAKKAAKVEKSKPSVPPGAPEYPFKELKKHFQLPPTSNTKSHQIDRVVVKNRVLMGAELVFDEDWARGKVAFQMKRSSENKQKWIVTKRNRSDPEEGAPVGHFWKDETSFNFKWLPSAADDEYVNYLQNGAIRLSMPDGQFGWLSLRRPVVIDGFNLSEKGDGAEVNVEIPWLPATKALAVEVQGFNPDKIPSHCIPELASKVPAKMYFTRKEELAFVWMDIYALGKAHGYTFQAKMRMLANGASGKFTWANLNQLVSVSNRSIQNIQSQIKMVEQKIKAQGIKKPTQPAKGKGKGKNPKNGGQPQLLERQYSVRDIIALKKQLKIAQTNAGVIKEYSNVLPKIKGEAIPVEIYLPLKGHRILIGTTKRIPKTN